MPSLITSESVSDSSSSARIIRGSTIASVPPRIGGFRRDATVEERIWEASQIADTLGGPVEIRGDNDELIVISPGMDLTGILD
jgi:hypothetical protein